MRQVECVKTIKGKQDSRGASDFSLRSSKSNFSFPNSYSQQYERILTAIMQHVRAVETKQEEITGKREEEETTAEV